jgi:hypothetical protein
MLLIFLPKTTERHQYVFSHIFGYLGIEFEFTNNQDDFSAHDRLKLSYSQLPLQDEMHFYADGLLDEKEIKTFEPETGEFNGVITLFPLKSQASALPYDVFSAVFYMLSRYEEYLPFAADEHGRFEATQSIAFRNSFLYTPVVDLWIAQLAKVLQQHFPSLTLKAHHYNYLPTYDIDIAYSFKHKGFMRSLGGWMRDGVQLNLHDYFMRIRVLLHLKADPYDSYDYLASLHAKYSLQAIYFVHPGTWSRYDKNSLPGNIIPLLMHLSESGNIGIHPSYFSAENPDDLKSEKKRLESACGYEITAARQHYIRLRFPDTYRNYAANGITDDYSMGYATDVGFRAGTSNPFLFFDISENKTHPLTIHPFVFMEGVFKFYRNLPESDIIANFAALTEQVKQTNGTFISLWHNESLGTSRQWKGWRQIYERMIELAKP